MKDSSTRLLHSLVLTVHIGTEMSRSVGVVESLASPGHGQRDEQTLPYGDQACR